jgi:predicted DCC family thiol-disulfide oxidoreductase YuxK
MRRLYVLYDQRCGLCSWARRWAQRQRAYLDLTFIPSGSERACRMFPELTRPGEPLDLIVVGDEGDVYRDSDAWIMCLYALENYRELSFRLARPLLRPLARQAFALVSKQRPRISRWLNLASDEEVADALSLSGLVGCNSECTVTSENLGSSIRP